MKIYTQDNQESGCIVVIAKNKKEARKLMLASERYKLQHYDPSKKILEHEIKEGFVYITYGDCH